MASAGCIDMVAAGIKLHPACRVRREGFGLLFYDSRGPGLLFAETGKLLPVDFFDSVRGRDELPDGLPEQQRQVLKNFISKLIERGFLSEQ